MDRIGASSRIRRRKLVAMFAAPLLSRLRGSMQSRCVQRRSPLIFLFIFSSTSVQGPHADRHLQHVFDVYASGVGATRNRFDSFRIRPTPMQGALPRLQAAPGRPATIPPEQHVPMKRFSTAARSLGFKCAAPIR